MGASWGISICVRGLATAYKLQSKKPRVRQDPSFKGRLSRLLVGRFDVGLGGECSAVETGLMLPSPREWRVLAGAGWPSSTSTTCLVGPPRNEGEHIFDLSFEEVGLEA